MAVLTDAQWRLIEIAYGCSSETVTAIAARHGVSPATVNMHRRKRGWPPRRAKSVKYPTHAAAGRQSEKAVIVARFYRLINLKLEQLEADMARPGERTSADHERETRAIGTLVRNYERVHGLDQEVGKEGRDGGDDTERGGETEAVRRELAEKIVRLRQSAPVDNV